MSFALIYAIFVTGLNLFMGYAGQVSFGHNAFAALGGYASAVLTATYAGSRSRPSPWGSALALLVALRGRLSDAAAQGPLSRHGHARDRPDRLRDRGPVAVGDAGYMGISGIPPLGIGGYEIVSDRGKLVAARR